VCIVAAGDGLFPRLVRAMGREDLLHDARFASFTARVRHADEINGIVGDWVRQHTAAEVEALLVAAQVPVTRAYSIADIAADPHYAARADIVTVDDPTIGAVRMQGVYPRLSETPGRIARGAPKLGEHNQEVYGSLLAMSAEEIAQLKTEGII
jgi:formyl-CoA transferase